MKLEIKHLVPYLPYELKIRDEISIYNFVGYTTFNKKLFLSKNKEYPKTKSLIKCKPILRSLADLSNKIKYDDREFIPLENLFGTNYTEWDRESESSPLCVSYTYKCSKGTVEPKFLNYWIIQQLLEWHFDIFNLIENNLAIDINNHENI